jgi:hypothetical protein
VHVAVADLEGEEDVDPFEGDGAVDVEEVPRPAWWRLVLVGTGARTCRLLGELLAVSAAA